MIKKLPIIAFEALCVCSMCSGAAGADSLSAAELTSSFEPVKIEVPAATLKQTLNPAMGLLSKGSETQAGALAESGAAQGAQVLIAARWEAPLPGQVSYIFYVKGLAPGLRGGQSREGSIFAQTWLDSAGQPTHFPQPYALVKLNGKLVYGKDVFAVKPPYKDIDEVARLLQENIRIDLSLAERRGLCSCGPAQFTLLPSMQLSDFKGQFPGYWGDLGLAAHYEKSPGGGACVKSGCQEYVGIELTVDQVSGEYIISDYHDGFLYAQYAAGALAAAKTGKDKQFLYAAHLQRGLTLFNSLFAAGAHLDAGPRKVIIESGKQGVLPGLSKAAAQKQAAADFGSLNRKMTLERIKSLRKAAALAPRSPMAHAGLGILLSRECARQVPLGKDSCENGIRELLKARELAPDLALPAYVLLSRADSQFFPARLRRLLNEDAASVCAKLKNSVPAWDWAFYSVCATAVKTDKEKAGEYLRAAQGIAVIRPKDLLLRYLDLELAAQ